MDAATQEEHAAAKQLIGSAMAVGTLVVVACLLIGAGIVAALMVARGGAPVPVEVMAPARQEVVLPCVEGWSIDGISGCAPAVSAEDWPGGEPLPVHRSGPLTIYGDHQSPAIGLMAGAGPWATLLASGLVILLLVPVLRSTAEARPFAPGNARRLAVASAATATAWAMATALPALAAPRAVASFLAAWTTPPTATGETAPVPAGWIVPDPQVAWWPLLVALLLGALAAAVARGTRLADDAEGLV
ncbi:hypothetical protein J4G33_05770 [Actinotalea sp. BY-33]|uniref:DUF2975 domain-containing protein n=1 Tax=Actinotalea soli TaxID=2819234 RepID=A0A939LU20_9CELL|nr:hypothetical protein [Actinotalea soli]MBO1751307.1 hypothetical protein [Actinotalea soli]